MSNRLRTRQMKFNTDCKRKHNPSLMYYLTDSEMVSQRCKQYRTKPSLTNNPPVNSLSLEVPLLY